MKLECQTFCLFNKSQKLYESYFFPILFTLLRKVYAEIETMLFKQNNGKLWYMMKLSFMPMVPQNSSKIKPTFTSSLFHWFSLSIDFKISSLVLIVWFNSGLNSKQILSEYFSEIRSMHYKIDLWHVDYHFLSPFLALFTGGRLGVDEIEKCDSESPYLCSAYSEWFEVFAIM